jgi:hypothetical protein
LPAVLSLVVALPAAAGDAVTGPLAARAYDRFKALDGTWVGQSTKGWKEKIQYTVFAKESCVMETSFDAHPNEMMVTMVCPDGDRLLLTHYCVATNQPRLVLTSATPDASELTFEFLDGRTCPRATRVTWTRCCSASSARTSSRVSGLGIRMGRKVGWRRFGTSALRRKRLPARLRFADGVARRARGGWLSDTRL